MGYSPGFTETLPRRHRAGFGRADVPVRSAQPAGGATTPSHGLLAHTAHWPFVRSNEPAGHQEMAAAWAPKRNRLQHFACAVAKYDPVQLAEPM